jgi:hypothetical protein
MPHNINDPRDVTPQRRKVPPEHSPPFPAQGLDRRCVHPP